MRVGDTMSGPNLLVVVLSLSVSAITIAVTTTVDTETSVTLSGPVSLSTPVEGVYTLEDCTSECELHYQGTMNFSLTQDETDGPLKVENNFEMESIEIVK